LANYNASYAIISPNNETFDIKTLWHWRSKHW
jgi:hypothetical protein